MQSTEFKVGLVKPILGGYDPRKSSQRFFYMSSSSYSQEAKAIAEANQITLIDGTMFLALILYANIQRGHLVPGHAHLCI